MELSVAGVEDARTDSRRSIPERLAQLKTIEQGWANLHFRQKHTLHWPQGHLWELYGGVLARGVEISATTRGLAFMRLPSAAEGSPAHTWEHVDIGVNIRDFAIDPAQDLAVVIAHPVTVSVCVSLISLAVFVTLCGPTGRSRKYSIHLRAMSSGGNHPNASDPILSCITGVSSPNYSFIIQVMGDFLAVLFHTAIGYLKAELFIWNWKTGRHLTSLKASSLASDITSVSFLSPRHFIITMCTLPDQQPELDVYDFLAEGSSEPLLVRRYQLPHVTQDTVMLSILTRSDPSPETSSLLSTTLGSSFCSAPSSRLLAVSMDFRIREDPPQSYVLFVHHSSLLEEVESTSMLNDKLVRWENWGPQKTRMMRTLFNEPTWVCYVHGTRYVRPEPFAIIGGAQLCRLRMLDFNQLALRRAKNLSTETSTSPSSSASSSSEEDEPPFHSVIVQESQPTIIEQDESVFVQRISTALPYREVMSREMFPYVAVMINQDCVVAHKWDPGTGDFMSEVEFLCI
ncbi:hypothetical protein JB92DRAFT_3134718 [Gautieria morchelliformis]|nr:hypothetical protein JB92DRAFT_3134718 [Gautieria morchelliformis]